MSIMILNSPEEASPRLLQRLELNGVECVEDHPALVVELLDAFLLMRKPVGELSDEVLILAPNAHVETVGVAAALGQVVVDLCVE